MMMNSFLVKTAVLLLSCSLLGYLPVVSSLSIQTGPEGGGDSVAGGIMYDRVRETLYVTGATDGNYFGDSDPSTTNCFLGIIDLAETKPREPFTTTLQLGKPDVPEACSALLHVEPHDKLYMAGASLDGGILAELRARGSLQSTVYGMIMQVHLGHPDNKFILEGGHLLHQAYVQYPIAMDRDAELDGNVYVASLISEDVTANEYYEPFVPQTYGYGSQFSVLVQQYSLTHTDPPATADDNNVESLQQTMVPTWQRELGASTSVLVAGILAMSKESLVLAGSTVGQDSAFPDVEPGQDFDGFVTELDPSTGDLTMHSYRVESQPDRDERIYGLCKRPEPHQQGAAQQYFYAVGTTTGNLDNNNDRTNPIEEAFIMKFELVGGGKDGGGFSMEWVKQFGTKQDGDSNNSNNNSGVQGLACAVTPDGNDVYMVGRVGACASLDGIEYSSAGGTDVFLVQLDSDTGDTNYLRQFGSSGNDYANDVVTDQRGNAIVYGTTEGSFYRDNSEGEQDVFLVSFSRENGTYEAPNINVGNELSPVSSPVSAPTAGDDNNDNEIFQTEPPATSPTTAAADDEDDGTATPPTSSPTAVTAAVPPPQANDNVGTAENQGGSSDKSKGSKVAITVIVLSIVALLGFFVYRRSKYGKDLHYSDEDHVVEYLKGFDDVEVDLKHSATGGWHGTYLNPRYQSSDTYSYNSETAETAVRFDANSSYVRDSLFMDDYDEPSFGSHNADDDEDDEREGLTRQRSNYDGLLDAYNTTWDELSPHTLPTRASPGPSQRSGLSEKKHVLETIDFMKEEDDAWGKEII